jgi:hypothetical protein
MSRLLTRRAFSLIVGLLLLLALTAATGASLQRHHRVPAPAPADYRPGGGGHPLVR